MKRMKGHVVFPSWLWDITSKSVDKSQSGQIVVVSFEEAYLKTSFLFLMKKVSFCPSLSPTFVASSSRVLCMIMAWLIDYMCQTCNEPKRLQ